MNSLKECVNKNMSFLSILKFYIDGYPINVKKNKNYAGTK